MCKEMSHSDLDINAIFETTSPCRAEVSNIVLLPLKISKWKIVKFLWMGPQKGKTANKLYSVVENLLLFTKYTSVTHQP
jgi:hypothetical protein